MDEQRGRRLTSAESDLVARQDLYEFDEDLLKEIADYFTGPYEREITVACESCGKIGTMIEKMPAGCVRLGIPHGFCYDCLKKMINLAEEGGGVNMREFNDNWFTYSERCGYKTKLTDITFFEEDGKYYFSVGYDVETESEKFLLEIPRIKIPIATDFVQICRNPRSRHVTVNLGLGGAMTAEEDHDGCFLRETIIEEKVREMTLDDIEKKLGYKVKIVNRD